MTGLVTIYALIDPRDMRCRYVGKTKHDVRKRLRGHINDAKRRPGEIPRFKWISALAKVGILPLAVVLEQVASDDWQAAEQMWVSEMRHRFPDLLNATAGGDGIHGLVHTSETRRRQSQAALNRFKQDGAREQLSAAVKIGMATAEAKAKLRANAEARSADPEFRRRLSETSREYSNRPEVKAARSAALTGRTISEDWRAKISASKTGVKASLEARARMSASRMGKRHSAETLERMRVARLAYYERKKAVDG